MSLYEDERDVTFDIIEEIGIISTSDTGWAKEINLIRWNGGVAKYDIREWDPTHQRMSKGITLKEDEMRRILDLMRRRRANARNIRRNFDASSQAAAEAEAETAEESEIPIGSAAESAAAVADATL